METIRFVIDFAENFGSLSTEDARAELSALIAERDALEIVKDKVLGKDGNRDNETLLRWIDHMIEREQQFSIESQERDALRGHVEQLRSACSKLVEADDEDQIHWFQSVREPVNMARAALAATDQSK